MPKHGNHHGSPKEILGEMMREDAGGSAMTPSQEKSPKILGGDGQPVQSVMDEKTIIQEFEPIKTMVLIKSRKESILITAKSNSSVCPYADVIAVGPLCVQLRVGDRVMIAGGCDAWPIPYRGNEDGDYLLVQEGNFYGIVNPRPREVKDEVCDQTPKQFESGEETVVLQKRTSADEEWERRQILAQKANQRSPDVEQSSSASRPIEVSDPLP